MAEHVLTKQFVLFNLNREAAVTRKGCMNTPLWQQNSGYMEKYKTGSCRLDNLQTAAAEMKGPICLSWTARDKDFTEKAGVSFIDCDVCQPAGYNNVCHSMRCLEILPARHALQRIKAMKGATVAVRCTAPNIFNGRR
jgi:hypothetical protein